MPFRIPDQLPILPQKARTRFAPSPTGFLHLGHVASAIFVWGLARRYGATIVLRIEDHDKTRVRKHFETAILEDLRWLGFHADEGVIDSEKPSLFRQSDHPERYAKALNRIHSDLYHCSCSRKEILGRTGEVKDELWYDGYCRARNQGPNLRLMWDAQAQTFQDGLLGSQTQIPSLQCGDLLLRDRDDCYTYNFAVTVDDIEDDINLIIRGEDILPATGRQLQLRNLLTSAPAPYTFHHPLIRSREDPSVKLSKRDGSTSIGQWRSEGHTAASLIGKAAYNVGLIEQERPLAVDELEGLFL